ncbi:hypothetical protein MRB53_038299 [Persea americana]|nr:hypothetical protein MRB53_038299 [Persea americana]
MQRGEASFEHDAPTMTSPWTSPVVGPTTVLAQTDREFGGRILSSEQRFHYVNAFKDSTGRFRCTAVENGMALLQASAGASSVILAVRLLLHSREQHSDKVSKNLDSHFRRGTAPSPAAGRYPSPPQESSYDT